MDNLLNARALAEAHFVSGDELRTNLPNETINFVGYSIAVFSAECTYWDGQGVDRAKALRHYGAMVLWYYGTMAIMCKLECLFN